nr:hypothetical protein BaRGS_000440 [Batillaria attramentaria]
MARLEGGSDRWEEEASFLHRRRPPDPRLAPNDPLITLLLSRQEDDRRREEQRRREEEQRRREDERRREKEEREWRKLLLDKEEKREEREAKRLETILQGLRGPAPDHRESSLAARLRPPDLQMPCYRPGEDIDAFLEQFESMAEVFNMSDADKVIYLKSGLKDKAREAVLNLPKQLSYTELKAALRRNLHMTPEHYRRKFRTMKKASDESFFQFGERMQKALSLWIESSGRSLDECILQEQLVETASPELKVKIIDRNPASFKEAIQITEAHADSRRYLRGEKTPSAKNGPSVSAMAPPATSNPDSDSPTKATETSVTGAQPRLCYYCHEPGHLVKACPKKKQANTRSEAVLFIRAPEDDPTCLSFACVVEGRVVDAIRDSGATTVFVDATLAEPEAPRGPTRRIVTVSGEMEEVCPTIIVDMSTPYFQGKVWAVAVPSPPFSLLIGNRVTMEDGEVCDISTDLPTRVDYATRYPEATPLKRIDSATVAEALYQMWTRTGIPKVLMTDQGTQFMSDVMQQVSKLLNVHRETSPPYHAQANGLVERFNATLKQMLKRLCLERPKDWDRFIPGVLFAYREVPQEGMKFSPFELLYGRTVRGPASILKQMWTQDGESPDGKPEPVYVLDLKERIAQTCELAHQNLARASEKYRQIYNRKARERWFDPEDEVLLLLPEKHNKLQLAWQGPFKVEKRVGDWDYCVRVRGKSKLVHANLLKKYYRRELCQAGFAPVVIDCEQQTQAELPHNVPTISLVAEETWEDVKICPSLSPEKRQQLVDLCREHQDVLTDLPLRCKLGECSLTLTQDTPVRVKQYPLTHSQMDVVRDEVRAMLKMGVIERSSSPYCSPILLVKKRDGKIRFVCDFRRLNRVLQFDAEPMPDIDAIFARIQRSHFFSKLDMTKGYWQLPMAEKDKPKTAFTTPEGEFQWTVMPFGLKTAGAIFSRAMRLLLEPLQLDEAHNFMDDLLVATELWERHVEVFRKILGRLREVQMAARPTKCQLGELEIAFLGHVLSEGRVRPEQDKLDKIGAAAAPRTKKELRSFLGLAGFYRKFVPRYAELALPLTDRTKKNQPERVDWDETCQQAFDAIRKALESGAFLQLPDNRFPYVLRTDASETGLGAALMQDQGQGLLPVAFASKKLSSAEVSYHTIELECLAVVWAIRRFYPYLYGRNFVWEADHHPLQYLDRIRPVSRRLMGWAAELQSFPFTFRYIKGSSNVEADYLSRITFPEETPV